MLLAKRIYFRVDLIAYPTCFLQPFFVRACEFGGIVKWPVQSSSERRENWTTFGLGFATNCDHELEHLSGLPNIENALCRVLGDIDSELTKRFHGEWIDCAWLSSRALRFKEFAAPLSQQCCRHLAASTVMNANEQNLLFLHLSSFRLHRA